MAQGGTLKVSDLFKRADELQEDKREVLEGIGANRETLRNLDKQGFLSDEESAKLRKLYPPVSRQRNGGKSDEQGGGS